MKYGDLRVGEEFCAFGSVWDKDENGWAKQRSGGNHRFSDDTPIEPIGAARAREMEGEGEHYVIRLGDNTGSGQRPGRMAQLYRNGEVVNNVVDMSVNLAVNDVAEIKITVRPTSLTVDGDFHLNKEFIQEGKFLKDPFEAKELAKELPKVITGRTACELWGFVRHGSGMLSDFMWEAGYESMAGESWERTLMDDTTSAAYSALCTRWGNMKALYPGAMLSKNYVESCSRQLGFSLTWPTGCGYELGVSHNGRDEWRQLKFPQSRQAVAHGSFLRRLQDSVSRPLNDWRAS